MLTNSETANGRAYMPQEIACSSFPLGKGLLSQRKHLYIRPVIIGKNKKQPNSCFIWRFDFWNFLFSKLGKVCKHIAFSLPCFLNCSWSCFKCSHSKYAFLATFWCNNVGIYCLKKKKKEKNPCFRRDITSPFSMIYIRYLHVRFMCILSNLFVRFCQVKIVLWLCDVKL